MISFCITCKNRSLVPFQGEDLALLPLCIDSIAKSCLKSEEKFEIVIADWNSIDYPLDEWVHDKNYEKIPIKVIQVTDRDEFSLAHGRNVAYDNSEGDKLFFIDADMLICPEVILEGIKDINQGYACFPICYFQKPQFPITGKLKRRHMREGWGTASYGNLLISRVNFELVGKWEGNSKYGGEDTCYVTLCQEKNVPIMRKRYENFIHQWHPKFMGWTHGRTKNKKTKVEVLETQRT